MNLSAGQKKSLRRALTVAGSIISLFILFAWMMNESNLNQYILDGRYLEGVVSEKDTRTESTGKGGSSTDYLVFVSYHFDGRPQSLLTSEYIGESQWKSLSVGDSVSLIYHPEKMYVSETGEIWFQDGPILEMAFQPALNRLWWYPTIALLVFLLSFLPGFIYLWRKKPSITT